MENLSGTQISVSYEELFENYHKDLAETLRGFNAGMVLDTWVPDEDHSRSILNLVEAAQIAGKDKISVFISPETADTLDLTLLQAWTSEIGKTTVKPGSGGIELEVSHMTEWPSFQRVNAAYRDGLHTAYRAMSHKGNLTAEKGLTLIQASRDGIRLMALVDPASHVIRKAAHNGEASDVEQGLLDALCEILVSVTIQEASDHACIYLEDALRDFSQKPPVEGVVTPENADPVFELSLSLSRDLLSRYANATEYTPQDNFFVRQPSGEWIALSGDEKKFRLKKVFEKATFDYGQKASILEIVEITDHIKITIRFLEDLDSLSMQELIMKLENAAKGTLDGTIHLILEEVKDMNSMRVL